MGKKTIILLALLVICLIYLGIINLEGTGNFILDFKINKEKVINFLRGEKIPDKIIIKPLPIETPNIVDDSIRNKKQIYEPGEIANINFNVENTLNESYNLSIDWFFNDERKKGWKNISTESEYCNVSTTLCSFYSWHPVEEKGNWKVQILVETNNKNYSLIDEAIIEFEVA